MSAGGRAGDSRAAALIIAGGQGTRFWPASRRERPKPLFSLNGRTTLLADTIARMPPMVPRERVFVLVPAALGKIFGRALKGLLPPANLLLEPQPRGTAVAIAYGCALIKQRLGECVIAVMPADHYVRPPAPFRATIGRAIKLASRQPLIVLVGVTPTRPDSGYGYLEVGKPLAGGFRVRRFVEKPRPAAARTMVRSGRFLWNAGMFIASTRTLEAELAQHCPELARSLPSLSTRAAGWQRLYASLRYEAFDYEVVEKSSNVAGVRARFRWDDVGSWNGLWEALRDRKGNALAGRVLALDSSQVLARADGRLMVLLGVQDLIAVDTDDALLIASRERAQDVRRVVAELKRRGFTRYL